ncbi:MAG TPA: hypothetical protein VMB05_11465 [Solirubrobacteraceae bacterium]|nr:hypothetical protein [Solirubrobacteraceae bacterium]
MTAASIGASKAAGYARYLESKTIEPERGDYYLSPTGEPTAELRPSTLAGQMVSAELARAAADGAVRPLRQVPTSARAPDGRAPWLEPYGGDPAWRSEMWGQVVALHGRYPRALSWLQEGWWGDEELTEIVCALAYRRAELDDAGSDSREEIAFHVQLRDISQVLREAGGGVTKAWKPGAPPLQWHAP